MPAGSAQRRFPGSGPGARIAMSGRRGPAAWAWEAKSLVPQAQPAGWDSGRAAPGWRPGSRARANRVRSSPAGRRHRSWEETAASVPTERYWAGHSRPRHQLLTRPSCLPRRRRQARRETPSAGRSAPATPYPRQRRSGRCQVPRRGRSRCRHRGPLPATTAGSISAEQRRDLVARCVRLLVRVVRALASDTPRRMKRGKYHNRRAARKPICSGVAA